MSVRTLATNAFWSLTSQLLSRGSLMIAAVILARQLTTPDFASYSYFQITVTMLATYAALGLGVTASRYFAEAGYEQPGTPQAPLGTLMSLSLLVSVAAFCVVFVLPPQWVNAGLSVPRWLLAAGVASIALGIVPSGAILGVERYRDATVISAVTGVLMLSAAWWAGDHDAPSIAMAAIVISALLQALGQYVIAGRVVGRKRLFADFGLRRTELRRVYAFAGPMMVVSLLAASGSWVVGRIILLGSGAEHAFALYTIGLQWFALTLLLPGVISRVLLPRLVRSARDGHGDNRLLVRQGALMATGTALAMLALSAILGPWLIRVYGSNYNAGPWFIAAFMVAGVVQAPVNTLGNSMLAHDGQSTWMRITIAGFAALALSAAIGTAGGLGAWAGAVANIVNALLLGVLALVACRRRGLV